MQRTRRSTATSNLAEPATAPSPEPTPGGVTDPRGTVGKTPLTDLVETTFPGIDPDALERVLVNLYLNAWRAVGGTGGSGCIRVAASRGCWRRTGRMGRAA